MNVGQIVPTAIGWILAIAVFVSDSRADDAMRRDVIARIAREAYDHFTGTRGTGL